MARIWDHLGVSTPFDPTHRFGTSWLLPPWALFALRALFSLYAFVVLFFIIAWQATHHDDIANRHSFSYFTVLTYWGLAFYFLFAALHTLTYVLSARHSGRQPSALLNRWPRPLQALHAFYHTTVITYPFLVTLVYWIILYSGDWFPTPFEAFHNISQHALNSVFALTELLLVRTLPPPFIAHTLGLIFLLALYLGLAYITRATEGFYVYNFLDPGHKGKGAVAGYVFGILAAIIVIMGIVWGLVKARVWVTEKKLGKLGKFAKGEEVGRQADLEKVGKS